MQSTLYLYYKYNVIWFLEYIYLLKDTLSNQMKALLLFLLDKVDNNSDVMF